MNQQIFVVTGSNRGIGYEITRGLARHGGRVVAISRDVERGQAAVAALQRDIPDSDIIPLYGDLGSVAGAQQLANQLLEIVPHIDVLIHNAGVWPTRKILNEEGLEMGFMVNFLAPFILSRRLEEHLAAAPAGRVVHVNAGLYVKGNVDMERTPYGADFGRFHTYATTKLCGVLTLPLEAAAFTPHGVTVNMVHPGVVNTDLGQMGGPLGWLLKLVKRSWMTPEAGAAAPLYLATSAAVADQSGVYFNETEPMPIEEVALDDQLARELWAFAWQTAAFD